MRITVVLKYSKYSVTNFSPIKMNLFEDIHEDNHGLIFQHLTISEVLRLSKVSKKWHKSIGNSHHFSKRVWINVGDRYSEPNKEILQAFRASDRNYQNFKIYEIENGLQILLFPKRCWKRALIEIQSYTSNRDYVNVLKICNETVIELDIFDMDIVPDADASPLSFNSLKKLRLGFLTRTALQPFVCHMPSLTHLIYVNMHRADTHSLLLDILQLQPQLKRLGLAEDAFYEIFKNEVDFSFQLTHFLVESFYKKGDEPSDEKEEATVDPLTNLESFIKKQKQLRWVTLCEWTCSDTMKIIFNHAAIVRISFDYFDRDSKKMDTNDLKLNVNYNITRMDFDFEKMQLLWLKPFLTAAPFVTTLYFFHVTQELLDYLLLNMKQLSTVKYCSIFEGFPNYRWSDKVERKVEIVEEKFMDLKAMIHNSY